MNLKNAIVLIETNPKKYALGYDSKHRLVLFKSLDEIFIPYVFYDFTN